MTIYTQNWILPLRASVASGFARWHSALLWGYGVALAHRLLLGLWMGAVWLVVGRGLPFETNLPPLDTPLAAATLGVWRHWDAVHYLNLALHGYTPTDPGPTVFGVLTPLGISLLNAVLPGGVDIAGMFLATASYGLALALLYRVCEVYFEDAQLGQASVILMGLLPLTQYFSAPMSDSLYLALALALFYTAARGRWLLAGLCGFLAALARTQGVLLAIVAGLVMLESQPRGMPWRQRLLGALRKGWPLILVPLGYAVFVLYRNAVGLPSLKETYANYSYVFFTDPLSGLYYNVRWFMTHLPRSLVSVTFIAQVAVIVLIAAQVRDPRYRRLPLVVFTVGYFLLFLSKIDWIRGTHQPLATLSVGRYSLTLFPLIIMLADYLRQVSGVVRLGIRSALFAGLLVTSALFALGLGPA